METYFGHVRTPADAIILFEACRIGLLPGYNADFQRKNASRSVPALYSSGMSEKLACDDGLTANHGAQVECLAAF
ncbi:hypothetical protein N7468_004782 [Penicillium chermesinum]|uniref:Uncharacterized protein n=1 Tax=Penicillium chermesinum TaxID=63820 RepID=A0A9W9PBG0_9EURO|nr:uncharacterized protein N7468_004782 [Penicillium chermesinum]KAJ5240163.1 hypothetical protein N7468_004782 [Penicillium chermesinum]